jgi:hypothetical protein
MQTMSRLFILFLIALLPLRSWSVERMGLQMDGVVHSAQAQGADEAAMSAECAMHMQAAMTQGTAPAQSTADHQAAHKACQSCQLCMPLAALEATGALAMPSPAQPLPASGSSRFASADAARCAKPPIS